MSKRKIALDQIKNTEPILGQTIKKYRAAIHLKYPAGVYISDHIKNNEFAKYLDLYHGMTVKHPYNASTNYKYQAAIIVGRIDLNSTG